MKKPNDDKQSNIREEGNKIKSFLTLLTSFNFWFALISVVSILLSAYLYYKNANTQNQLNQVEAILHVQKAIMQPPGLTDSESLMKIDSLTRLLEVQELKEDYYINQLNVLSDWFILFVTGLIALSGFLGYSTIKTLHDKIETLEKKNKEQFDKYDEKNKQFESHFEKMRGITFMITADLCIQLKDYTSAFFYRIYSIDSRIQSLKIYKLLSDDKDVISNEIIKAYAECEYIGQNSFSEDDNKSLNNLFRGILKTVSDKELEEKISELWLLFKQQIRDQKETVQNSVSGEKSTIFSPNLHS